MPVDWEVISERLREIERHIATGERLIAKARAKLARAIHERLNPAEGENVLCALEGAQRVYLEERILLKKALARLMN